MVSKRHSSVGFRDAASRPWPSTTTSWPSKSSWTVMAWITRRPSNTWTSMSQEAGLEQAPPHSSSEESCTTSWSSLSSAELSAIKPCVGCAHCCRTAMCAVGFRVFGSVAGHCPALTYKDGRYWCDLCRPSSLVAGRYRKELFIGEGCCSPLNSDRQNIPPPGQDVDRPKIGEDCRLLLRAMAHQWFTSDQLWLTLNEVAQTMGGKWMAEACRIMREERSSISEQFMG